MFCNMYSSNVRPIGPLIMILQAPEELIATVVRNVPRSNDGHLATADEDDQ